MKFGGYHGQWCQLTGNQSKVQPWIKSGQLTFKMDDIPSLVIIGDKVYAVHPAALKLHFHGTIQNSDAVNANVIAQDEYTPGFVKNVQLDGTLLGAPFSSVHMIDGFLDSYEFFTSGMRFTGRKEGFQSIAASGHINVDHELCLPLCNGLQKEPQNTLNPSCCYDQGNFVVNLADHLYSNGVVDVADELNCLNGPVSTMSVTCSIYLVYKDEITVAPGYQLTRFKSTAAIGTAADTIMLPSFGANHTLEDAKKIGSIFFLLWGSSVLRGSARGAGQVSALTDFSASSFGISQTQELRAYMTDFRNTILELSPSRNNYLDEPTLATSSFPASDAVRPLDSSLGSPINRDLDQNAQYFPIIQPRRGTMITKCVQAKGSPSYNLTGTFAGDHWSYLYAAYQWQENKMNAIIDRVKSKGLGTALYKDNDLIPIAKASKKNEESINFSKAEMLTSKLLPRSFAAKPAEGVK